jgi:molecular chaperone GrpE
MAEPTNAPENGAGTGNTAGATVADNVESLRDQLATVEQERDQFRDLAQRTRADFENYQKRATRDAAQERRYAHGSLAQDLLPVLDNLERAAAAAKQAEDNGPLAQGVNLVLSQFLDLLRRHGITPIEAAGQPFDPNLHQAVMQRPSGEHVPNTVLEVLEKGFKIHDRVLRPARVVVSTAKD